MCKIHQLGSFKVGLIKPMGRSEAPKSRRASATPELNFVELRDTKKILFSLASRLQRLSQKKLLK